MAGLGINRCDIFLWLNKVIESCNTWEQLQVCSKLKDQYFSQYSVEKDMQDNIKHQLDKKEKQLGFE